MKNYLLTVLLAIVLNTASHADEAGLEQQCAPYRKDESVENQRPADLLYTDGLLWKVEKDNRTNYLFGTIHSQDPRVTEIPPQVRLAMIHTDTYLVEVEQDAVAGQAFLDAMYMEPEQSLASHLHPEILGLLEFKAEKYGIDRAQADKLHPWAAFSLIGRPRPIRALTLDQLLMNYALSRNHEVHALETMNELVASLDSIPMQDQIEILTDTLCNHNEILENTGELVRLYMRADARGIALLNSQPHRDEDVFDRYMQIMLYDRNERMIERMLPWFEQGRTFAAVGISHLFGERGLLARLVNMGYTVEKVF